jgi:hypothetical protein
VQEAAAVHAGMVGRLARQAVTLHSHPDPRISASAFSSQYVMPMPRYIVVAVVSCALACSRLSGPHPVRASTSRTSVAVGRERKCAASLAALPVAATRSRSFARSDGGTVVTTEACIYLI